MRMSPIVPKLIGSIENFTFSICAGMPSASRNPCSSLASSSVPTLVISTQVVPSSAFTDWYGSSFSSGISFSSMDESHDRITVIYPSDLCIEQAAFPEPLLERLLLRRRDGDQQPAARLRVAHQCELRIGNRQLHAPAERVAVAHAPFRPEAACE